ncbi:hypothetical protein WICMUC_005307 [Wickerhamomyces mucosus]|uniref:Uncharacterized protein n=1 Tax=Wickerhamomyces mucosus TaxID=1378264 RepID=A0A9P8T747_9ASCO|nr:hypothetical protein WICMUC_005307 [Wickerhamomyces mucosus]
MVIRFPGTIEFTKITTGFNSQFEHLLSIFIYYSKMQFKSVVIALASVAAVQAANSSNASNHSNGTTTSVSTGAAASNAMGAGVFGAAVAAGVAFLL